MTLGKWRRSCVLQLLRCFLKMVRSSDMFYLLFEWYVLILSPVIIFFTFCSVGSCLQKSLSDLNVRVKNIIQTINELHLKHQSLASAMHNHRDTDAKNKAELNCLKGNSLFLIQVNGNILTSYYCGNKLYVNAM